MSAPPELIEVLQQWIGKAESDYIVAQHAMQLKPEDCPFDVICFHCQQVVEKYLKILQIFLGVDPPKTHMIDELLALLPKSFHPTLSEKEQEILNDYAVISRYPGGPIVGSPEAIEALRLAGHIRSHVRAKLPPQALERFKNPS